MHLKPFTYLTITLLTKQNADGTPAYLTTPKMVAEFEVTIDSLYETVNQEYGYEASLADITYDVKNFEDRGVVIKFQGYSSTLPSFVRLFVDTMHKHSKTPFSDSIVKVATEKLFKQYKNANVDVYGRCNNNRLLHLVPHKHHSNLVEKELKKMMDGLEILEPSKILSWILG